MTLILEVDADGYLSITGPVDDCAGCLHVLDAAKALILEQLSIPPIDRPSVHTSENPVKFN